MIDVFDPSKDPHRRYNILTGEWILVSPQRGSRPWRGMVESPLARRPQPYDPSCYLCPGNERAGGVRNPAYETTYAFDNDFTALKPGTPQDRDDEGGLLIAQGEPGICRVICFSPRHDLTLADMNVSQILGVVNLWTEEINSLSEHSFIHYVQIFENKGELMGCSNAHPHGQIWAQLSVPGEPGKETGQMQAFRKDRGDCMLCEYVRIEARRQERIVCENEDFLVLVPFWAVWPYETLVLPRRHLADLRELSAGERQGFADILRRIAVRYDNLFQIPFPYSSGIHQAPVNSGMHPEWHMHVHFYPPLLRSATVKKFMVGYEMLADPQRDLTAEEGAARLRECSEVHFRV